MSRSSGSSNYQSKRQPTITESRKHNLTSIDPYSILGLGAALALIETEEEIARLTAGAITSAFRVQLGAVVLQNVRGGEMSVSGQFRNAPLEDALAEEIKSFLSSTATNSSALSGEDSREIKVREEHLPKATAAGLYRLLLVRLRTIEYDFGVVIAGKTSDEPYLPVQTASLEALASQVSMALHRIQLNNERAVVEAALRESEGRTRTIVDTAVDGIITIDDHGTIESFNPAAAQIFGYAPDEILGQNVKILMPEPYHSEHDGYMANYLNTGQKAVIGIGRETVGRRKDGTTFPIYLAVSEMHLGERRLFTGILSDITERKRAEKALRESEERLACILESAMDAIITINDARRIVLFNEAAEKVFRCPATEAIGQSFDRFICEPCGSLLLGYVQASDQSGETKRTLWAPEGLTALRADGEEFPIEVTMSQVEVSGQKLYTVILRDINERKKAEAELNKLQLEKVYLQEEIKSEYNFGEIIGASAAMKKVFQNIEKVAATDSTVLLSGETGTGKELIARAIHTISSRKDIVLVKVNCPALPAGLVESELFGHEKGAFTGATTKKKGRFELANGGTIFLDEVGELSLETQTKLLRVLQEQEFERVGGTQTQKVNVRVIAATNRNLEEAVKLGAFRADLFYRLNIFPIHIPALRERIEDIPVLTNYFIRRFSRRMGKMIYTVSSQALEKLISYGWPGNLRELANVLERAVILCEGGVLQEEHIGISIQHPTRETKISTLEEVERMHIQRALEKTGGVVGGPHGAARLLGMKRTTLLDRIRKLGISKKP